jgi:hypothetical protein
MLNKLERWFRLRRITNKQKALAMEMQYILDQSNDSMIRIRQIERECEYLAKQEIDLNVRSRFTHQKLAR